MSQAIEMTGTPNDEASSDDEIFSNDESFKSDEFGGMDLVASISPTK